MKKKTKIFVLDTSVLIHDHHAIINFKQHDVAVPITVLEELDKFKLGNDTKNFSAREVIRFIDKLVGNERLTNWIDIESGLGKFKIIMDSDPKMIDAERVYASSKNDHKIINAALILQEEFPTRNVVLVTKDINLRIKAKALGVAAEDYETGKVYELKNDLAPDYIIDHVDSDLIREVFTRGTCEEQGILGSLKRTNGYYILKNGKTSSLVYYNQTSGMLERIEKEFVYGIKPKNAEQAFALHALTNPEIKLVALQGVAGTGKTLLALAAALEQEKKFNQIILARPIVPLSNKEIGFLAHIKKDIFILGLQSELRIVNLKNKETIRSIPIEEDKPLNRINDGKIDPKGRLWFGTMDNPERSIKNGSLYCLDKKLNIHKVDTKYYITNGPAFINAENFLHTDSRSKTIYKIKIDKNR